MQYAMKNARGPQQNYGQISRELADFVISEHTAVTASIGTRKASEVK
jgi:hypothetical protein